MRLLRLPEPLAADMEVWCLDMDLRAPVAEADWAVLGGDEGGRALRLRRHEDKIRFIRTRAALRRLLAERLRCAPQAVRVVAGPRGKPRLAADRGREPMLDFNVSHSGRFALIAIAQRGTVGVDIEYCNPELDAAALEPQVLSPLERQLSAHERPAFFDHWVAKEATLKAIGVGIAEDLQHISVLNPAHASDSCYRLQHGFKHWPTIGTWPLEAPNGYAAALAWTAAPCTTQLQ